MSKALDFSTEAREVLDILSHGGQLLKAGMTGERWVVFRDQRIVSRPFARAIAEEIRRAGVLTKTGALSQSARTRERLLDAQVITGKQWLEGPRRSGQ